MIEWASIAAPLAVVAHEFALFAAVGFVIGGFDDLAVDLIWLYRAVRQRVAGRRGRERAEIGSLAAPERPG